MDRVTYTAQNIQIQLFRGSVQGRWIGRGTTNAIQPRPSQPNHMRSES